MQDFLIDKLKDQQVNFLDVKCSDIRLQEEASIIKLKGTAVRVNETAFKEFLKILGVNLTSFKNMESRQAGLGRQLVNDMLVAAKNQKMKLFFAGKNPLVSRIGDPSKILHLSPKKMGEILEAMPENFAVSRLSYHADGTRAEICVTDPNQKIDIGIGGEEISPGKLITWDLLEGLRTSMYTARLICDNGMIDTKTFKMLGTAEKITAGDVWNHLFPTVDPATIVKRYAPMVEECLDVKLSVREYESLSKVFNEAYSNDIEKIVGDGFTDSWKNEYLLKGFDLKELNTEQKSTCPTSINCWDAVNILTDMASHKYKSPVPECKRIEHQKLAGIIMSNPDMKKVVLDVPSFN